MSLHQWKAMSVPAVERRVDGKYFACKARLHITIGDFSRIGGKGTARRVTFRRRPGASSSSSSSIDDEDSSVEEPLAGVGAVASMEMEESSSMDGDAETSAAGVAHSHCSGDDCAGSSGSEFFFKEKLSPSRVAEYHNRGVRRASARQAERAVKGSVTGG